MFLHEVGRHHELADISHFLVNFTGSIKADIIRDSLRERKDEASAPSPADDDCLPRATPITWQSVAGAGGAIEGGDGQKHKKNIGWGTQRVISPLRITRTFWTYPIAGLLLGLTLDWILGYYSVSWEWWFLYSLASLINDNVCDLPWPWLTWASEMGDTEQGQPFLIFRPWGHETTFEADSQRSQIISLGFWDFTGFIAGNGKKVIIQPTSRNDKAPGSAGLLLSFFFPFRAFNPVQPNCRHVRWGRDYSEGTLMPSTVPCCLQDWKNHSCWGERARAAHCSQKCTRWRRCSGGAVAVQCTIARRRSEERDRTREGKGSFVHAPSFYLVVAAAASLHFQFWAFSLDQERGEWTEETAVKFLSTFGVASDRREMWQIAEGCSSLTIGYMWSEYCLKV